MDDLEKIREELGIRDYTNSDPEIRRRAVEEKDIKLSMSIAESLIMTSLFDLMLQIIQNQEQSPNYILNYLQLINTMQSSDKVIEIYTRMRNEVRTGFLTKQKELFSEVDH